jgi:hypothetical protein
MYPYFSLFAKIPAFALRAMAGRREIRGFFSG